MVSAVEAEEVVLWASEAFEEVVLRASEQEEQHGPNAAGGADDCLWSDTSASPRLRFCFGGSSTHRIVTKSAPPCF